MCFRPADVSAGGGAAKYPECGKAIQAMAGVTPKNCPFCKADFGAHLDSSKPLPSSAPSAPAAPGAPKPPNV